ncbi:zinc finger protein ZFMSA12A-like [Xyrichtys novacula]|uniref:Zinc finger protein ZFMSA12A-like n=1 Tax=Xyrichtys novacula TaxID=13765 RepID=A0AAV1HN11_XYRNO|nr:zinc finger protein ZFMSA12A-like [Xyrichtys novacula]
MASSLPLSSLRLLIPPLRLLTAAMWQVAQHQSVKHYGMLADFVSLVTEAVPQLLTDRQRSLLLLALRAKVTQIREDVLCLSQQSDEEVGGWCSVLSALTEKLPQSPADRQRLLQEVFSPSFDSALQSFISDFLTRIEQLFPVPDFKQAASWLDAVPGGVEDYLQEANKEDLRELLTNQSCRMGQATNSVSPDTEKILLSAWSHPFLTKLTNPDPPPPDTVAQSGDLPDQVSPLQLDVELVKVEVVVMMGEEREEEVEETVISGGMSLVEQEASNESSAIGGSVCLITPEVEEEDRLRHTFFNHLSFFSASQSDQSANAIHSISHNSRRVAHRCPQCGKCFIYRSQVIRHLKTNKSCSSGVTSAEGQEQEPSPPEPHPPRSHSCFQCNAVFKTKAELLSHQRSHRARPIYQCSQCDREFHHLSSLTNHKQTHLDRSGFTCSRCNKVFESAKERDAHRLQHRLPDLTCTVCEQTFSSQSQLLRHLQTHSVEGAEPCYSCRFCEQTFKGVTQLRIHQRTHTFRTYQCDQCSKSYGSLTGLQSHRATHSAESRFLCPQCGKRFKTRDGLEGHLRTHTGERPYRCPYCPKDFTALAGLNVHVRRHTGERPYVCTVCGKGWPSGGDLQKHMRIHTGERPYICQDCGKAFSISCHLTEHRRIHTGEKPFSCPECGKCLRRKFDLKKHMLSHSSVRPYGCVHCSKSYTRKTHLNRHLLTHRTGDGEAGAEMTDES